MKLTHLAALATAVLAAAACSGASYQDDLKTICDAPNRGTAEGDATARAVALAEKVKEAVKTKEGKELVNTLGNFGIGSSARREILEKEAQKAGIADCALATLWRGGEKKPDPDAGTGADTMTAGTAHP